jgi:hypothetical protein
MSVNRLNSLAARMAALAVLATLSTPASAADVSFRHDVMAVLSKAGCNLGTCHGNKNGKGGFLLTLRGQDPDADFKTLTRDQFGRRVNLLDPEASLLLLKATQQVAHEGGQRFKTDSEEYALLRRWLAAGQPDDRPTLPTLTRVEVKPAERIVFEPETTVQLTATAIFADGTRRDVTTLAVYEPSAPSVKVTREGSVQRQQPGEVAVLARYLDQQAPVRLAFLPARPNFKWSGPVPANHLDEHIFAKLKAHRINPSALCPDEIFLRRAHLDLLGLPPTVEEARAFLAGQQRDKRTRLISQLVERPEFADFWAVKWGDLLRNEELTLDTKGVQNFHHWIRQSLAENKPLDQFVRELVSARGSTYANPAANYYRANRDPVRRAEMTAQLFLGTRLQCAQCHNHPFDRWTQDDYHDWTALFSQVDYKVLANVRRIGSDRHEWNGEQIVHAMSTATVPNPRTGKPATPRFLGGNPQQVKRNAPAEEDALEALANWLTSPQNELFVKAQVNRVWFHLMGRGLVEPLDDFRATNPASHPALLDALAKDFVQHQFDLRWLIGFIMQSRTYQLASEPNDSNRDDEVNYSHALLRRLTAEQLLDAQSQATGVPLKLAAQPVGTRASQLPGAKVARVLKATPQDKFLELFGKPLRLFPSESERCNEPTVLQAFQMISGPAVHELISHPENRLAQLLAGSRPHDALVTELYWAALTRAPSRIELDAALADLAKAKEAPEKRAALEDLLWGLLNAKEFSLRR